MKIIIAIFLCAVSISLYSQPPKDEYGFADKSIPELAQFEYYRGVWNTKMEMVQKDGTFKAINNTAIVKGWYLEDHRTFQTTFTPAKGTYSTDVRTFNVTTKEWKALFLNPQDQFWHEFTCKEIDGKMNTIVAGGYSGKEKFTVKSIDTIISENNYRKDVYYSYDQMKTWVHVYKMFATRT